jgi:hypothetical protein
MSHLHLRRPPLLAAAEDRVARQCDLVDQLTAHGHAARAAEARATLVLLEQSLRTVRHSAALLTRASR